jgi:hypothetical protein
MSGAPVRALNTVSILRAVLPMHALNPATESTAKPSKANSVALRRGEACGLAVDMVTWLFL